MSKCFRLIRRNFRGGRGGGRPRSQDSQGQAGEQVGQDGPRGPPRQRYRRRGPPRPRGGNSQSEPGSQPNTKVEKCYSFFYLLVVVAVKALGPLRILL